MNFLEILVLYLSLCSDHSPGIIHMVHKQVSVLDANLRMYIIGLVGKYVMFFSTYLVGIFVLNPTLLLSNYTFSELNNDCS